MTKGFLVVTALVAAVATNGRPAITHDDDDRHSRPRRFEADLRGVNEVPAVSTAARGSFQAVLSRDETLLKYSLRYKNLQGTVTQAHIHVGAHHTNGGISIWLCGNPTAGPPAITPPAGTPACPTDVEAEVARTVAATEVVGPNAQLIAPGELAELVKMLRSGRAYANVHTTLVPSGEIRGQIRVDD